MATTDRPARQEAAGQPPAPPDLTGPALTERELRVLRGMSRGKSDSAIGQELYLSVDTIKTLARLLFRKIGVVARRDLIAHAKRPNEGRGARTT